MFCRWNSFFKYLEKHQFNTKYQRLFKKLSQFSRNKINTLLIIKEDDDNDMMNLMIYVWFSFIKNIRVQRFKSSFTTTVFLLLSVNFFWKHPPLFLFKKKYNNDCCKSFFSERGMCSAKCFGVYTCTSNVVVCQYLTIWEPIYILNDTWSRFDMQISVLLLIFNMLHFWLFVIVMNKLNVSRGVLCKNHSSLFTVLVCYD